MQRGWGIPLVSDKGLLYLFTTEETMDEMTDEFSDSRESLPLPCAASKVMPTWFRSGIGKPKALG